MAGGSVGTATYKKAQRTRRKNLRAAQRAAEHGGLRASQPGSYGGGDHYVKHVTDGPHAAVTVAADGSYVFHIGGNSPIRKGHWRYGEMLAHHTRNGTLPGAAAQQAPARRSGSAAPPATKTRKAVRQAVGYVPGGKKTAVVRETIGTTSSGKPVLAKYDDWIFHYQKATAGFTQADHADASKMHRTAARAAAAPHVRDSHFQAAAYHIQSASTDTREKHRAVLEREDRRNAERAAAKGALPASRAVTVPSAPVVRAAAAPAVPKAPRGPRTPREKAKVLSRPGESPEATEMRQYLESMGKFKLAE